MRYRNLLTAAVTLALLAACGGSTNNSNNKNGTVDPGSPSITPAAAGSGEAPSSPADGNTRWDVPNNNNGNGNNGNGNNGNGNNGNTTNPKRAAINTVNINGQNIQLLPDNMEYGTGGYYEREDNSYKIVSGYNLRNASYGMVHDKQRGSYETFFRGLSPQQVTTTMPKSGEARYLGQAVHQTQGADIQRGNSQFDVNFATRIVDGTISVQGKPEPITLKARISNNTFTGFTDDQTTRTNGSFYGQNAAEMVGVYEKVSSSHPTDYEYKGAFGATRQP